MSGSSALTETYLTGLRNQHGVETQAIGTIQNQLGRMEPYPELHAPHAGREGAFDNPGGPTG